MKAISIHQPWASLIAFGEKRFETRSWKTDYRGPLLIHASRTFINVPPELLGMPMPSMFDQPPSTMPTLDVDTVLRVEIGPCGHGGWRLWLRSVIARIDTGVVGRLVNRAPVGAIDAASIGRRRAIRKGAGDF